MVSWVYTSKLNKLYMLNMYSFLCQSYLHKVFSKTERHRKTYEILKTYVYTYIYSQLYFGTNESKFPDDVYKQEQTNKQNTLRYSVALHIEATSLNYLTAIK